jgi:hypothetical protein
VFCHCPDLNPIEYVWDLLDRRMRSRTIPAEMFGNLQVPWGTAVLNAAGGHQILTVTFDFEPPFVQGHIIPFLFVTCLWNLFSLCLRC